MFEIRTRDAGGRIGKWSFGKKKHTVNTPQIAIVINPNQQIIPPIDLEKKFGAELVITNAYIAKKSRSAEEIQEKGLHKYFKWKGPIYTDSGTYQMFSKGNVTITPQETIDFQKKIGSDIITPLDLFTVPQDSRETAEKNLFETISRIKGAREIVKNEQLVGPVQGGSFPDLRKRAAMEVSKIAPDIYAVGGIVPLMNQYRFRELMDVILTAKMNLTPEKPIHAFGCGHPMIFSLLVAVGIDLFDSAAYALYAKDNRYMTERGTEQVSELHELPCECPVCSKYKSTELDEKLLAEHNLYQTFKEIKTIKHAIHEGTLWELVEQRIRAHPHMIEAYRHIRKYNKYLETVEPISRKKAYFETGIESRYRPEVYRVKERVKELNEDETFEWQKIKIPCGLKNVYPIGQSLLVEGKDTEIKPDPETIVKTTLKYQYGKGAEIMISKDTQIVHSKNTGRIRSITKGNTLLGTLRAHDGLFIPTAAGASELRKHIGKQAYCVKITTDAIPFVKEGCSVFSKFVADADEKIRPGDEVFVTDDSDNLIATGTALMNRKEMSYFKDGVAVKTRHVKEESLFT
ncbi:MAG: tRNA guanosine(15) transglycosylase TgtA [archaeon]